MAQGEAVELFCTPLCHAGFFLSFAKESRDADSMPAGPRDSFTQSMKDLTRGHEAGVIIKFALPLLAGNFLQQAYSLVDSVIVGQFVGKEALAAIGASFPIVYTLIAFLIGIGSGATVIISQYYGAANLEKVKRATSTIFVFLFYASLAITILGITFSESIFRLLKVDETVIPLAVTYFNIYMLGMVAFFGVNSIASVLRGLGDSVTSFWFLLIATVLNVVLDLLFILVFHWGVAGAAIATVIAHFVAFLIGILYLNKRHSLISFRINDLVFDREVFLQAVKIGLPTGFQQTFVALGLMALIRIVNQYDTAVLAAYTVASRIDALASMPALNLASALSAFVGQNLGAGKIARIQKGLTVTLYMSWAISLVVMLLAWFAGEWILKAFTSDAEVIAHGVKYLIIVGSFYLVFSAMLIIQGLLRGAGDTLVPMFISLFSLWLGRVPLAIVLSKYMGEVGIWWSIPLGWCLGLAGAWAYYRMGRWQLKAVINLQKEKHVVDALD